MKVSVFGLEHFVCDAAAGLVRLGHTLTGATVDTPGHTEHYESAGSAEANDTDWARWLDARAMQGTFHRAADLQSAVLNSDVSLVCQGVLSNSNGSQNLRGLDRIFIQIGTALARKTDYHLILVQSPVLPGTVEGRFTLLLEQHSGRRAGADFGICMNPAFRWAASGPERQDQPAQIVIGELDARSGDTAQKLYSGLDVPILRTTIQTAEMLTFVSSAFHAVKITFANEIGNLCQSHGIDGRELVQDLCVDGAVNISSPYLRPGFSIGGTRLLRDLRALLHRAKEQDVDCPLLNAVLPSNQRQISRAIELIEQTRRSKIGIVGLLFRTPAADLHDHPVIQVAEILAGKGYCVRVFGENANLTFARDARTQATVKRLVSPSLHDVIQESEVVVLANHDVGIRDVRELLSDKQILIDLAGPASERLVTSTRKSAPAPLEGIREPASK